MPGACIIGLQWGDEAKGKLCDLLAPRHEIVVRYLGGANAGHTVVAGGETFKLHHIPSGILYPEVINVVTPGVVMHPGTMLEEIDELTSRGVAIGENLMLSDRMHVVLPWHIAEDRYFNESSIGGESLGTTLRGIGPCYRDKVGRTFAIRLGDMYRDDFAERIARITEAKQRMLAGMNGSAALDPTAIHAEYRAYAERLRPYVADTTNYLLDAVQADRRVLFEGAQGSLLDVDHGTYPFVTSSNASALGVGAGAGVPARWIGTIIGVAKAYGTRVGGGPFPTEQDNEVGQAIRVAGNEFGTTTGRPRRCGWFDAVLARYTCRLSGVDVVALMMLDVLSAVEEIQICVAYELDGRRIDWAPSHAEDLRRVQPIYETLPGWQVDITGIRRREDLPPAAQRYVERVSDLLERPIGVISVGPDRVQTMFDTEVLPVAAG